jgi:predicted nucleic acid-binding protein
MAEQPLKLVLDTSIYIPFINKGIAHPAVESHYGHPLLYLSAVVIEELYAGALDVPSMRLLDKLYDTFSGLGRLVTPDASDWQKAGKVVANLGRKYGFENIFLTKITHDILIALSARRIGAAILTNNMKDFVRIQEFVDFKLYG